ncbi:MAG TPA: Crp/Fnr family transcriptional regulator, partial [Pyrinomonadaceae bacterium]|nr:Crp/Fnr family transcriptional regulator [Pyrinomonadaceae bacterium]
MHELPHSRLAIENTIISALPPAEFEFLVARMEPVSIKAGTVLANFGDTLSRCYFPSSGMVSLLSVTEHGKAIEVGYTGFEGMVGLPVVLGASEMPYQALGQTDSDGFSVDAGTVMELFRRHGVFHDAVLRYTFVVLRQVSQTAVCNHFHPIQARLARWMTVMAERSGHMYLSLTQEFVAHMLGVQRTSIGMIATAMQNDGIIRYRRGRVEILDFERLRSSACECYFIITNEQNEYISDSRARHASD